MRENPATVSDSPRDRSIRAVRRERLGDGMGHLAACLTAAKRIGMVSRTFVLAWGLAMICVGSIGVATHAEAAEDQLVVTEVEVSGNQRIEAETVRSYTLIKPGAIYSPELADQSLKQLFGTGIFADITMRLEGTKLVVSVVENPIINRVAFEGNSAIKEEDLQKEVQLQPRVIY